MVVQRGRGNRGQVVGTKEESSVSPKKNQWPLWEEGGRGKKDHARHRRKCARMKVGNRPRRVGAGKRRTKRKRRIRPR